MSVRAVPSPVGGWNVQDALADMPEDHASILDNWFPGEGRVDIRPGFSSYATGMTGDVETLAEYISGATRKLVAAANLKLWDISSSGAATQIGTGYTNNRWDTINMDGKIGFCNGADTPLQWDGTTLSTLTITGVTSSSLIGCNVFSGRSYWWAANSQSVWYSAVNTLGGTVSEFDLSRVGNFGGKLVAMGNWTHDSGAGADDFAVFFLSSGETIVYQGSDPSNWSLLGVFRFGSPVSRRAIIKLGGDLVVVTVDGYVSLMGAITQGRVSDRGILSEQINPAVSDVVKQSGSNFGWQAFFYPRGNMVMFNIPLTTNSTYNQHVFNTNTGAPCRFKGINSRCWSLYNDRAYFGGEGVVYLFGTGYDDNGVNIEADALTAVTYLGDRTRNKHLVMLKPVAASDGVVSIATEVGADFKNPSVAYDDPMFVGGDSDWDTASWDTASWSSGDQINQDWEPTEAYGYNFRTRVRVRVRGQNIKWYAMNYMYNLGGVV